MFLFRDNGFLSGIISRAVRANRASEKTIVFADSDDNVLRACSQMIARGICTPLILGDHKVAAAVERLKLKNITGKNIFNYLDDSNKAQIEAFAKKYFEIRTSKGKTLTMDEALSKMHQPHYYGAMFVAEDKADGLISGYNSSTKPYYPAFEIILLKEGISRVSGLFIMIHKNDEKYYFFSDCAININPSSEQLAEIALTTAGTCISMGVKPRVAMLSFSTNGSAKHELVDKVRTATELAQQKDKDLIIAGEIQLDAAIVPEICKKKYADSKLEGDANVLIFPDLNAGNIGYKLVERLGHYRAIGPIMQGLNKPVNDLSRGSSVEDIAALAAVTVLQGL